MREQSMTVAGFDGLAASPHIDLGPLRADRGNNNYADTARISSVIVRPLRRAPLARRNYTAPEGMTALNRAPGKDTSPQIEDSNPALQRAGAVQCYGHGLGMSSPG
jgi:hypothetical protein